MGSDINFFEAEIECHSYNDILVVKLRQVDCDPPYAYKVFWKSTPHKVIDKRRLQIVVGCRDALNMLPFALMMGKIPLKHEGGYCPGGFGQGSWGPKKDELPFICPDMFE